MEKPDFKKMCLMYIQQLTNFPYIEKDFDALTDYQLLCKVVAYLNKIITNENQQNETITGLYNAFVELKDYVDNYFDNLDVQEEINNKLDAMAQSGELNEYIKKLDYFIVDNTFTQEDIQKLMNLENAKIIEFKDGTYNFDNTFILNKDTTLLLNNANLVFSVIHGFYNFKNTDEFLEYNGNGNIKIIGGTINAGISFIHGKDLTFKNINFYHVLNDHVFELCSLKNVYIENCEFEGIATQTDERNYVEYIQIDDCTYSNFPHLDENNPTYDETPNYNINIEKCIFKKPNIITFNFYTAIGGHTYIENKYHKYITIKNNEFYNSENTCIRLHNTENVIIDNNLFNSTNENNVLAILLNWHQKNITISNNESNYKQFLNNNTRTINIEVKNNYIHDIPNNDEYIVIQTQPTTNFKVLNNLFENVYSRIIDNRERTNILDNEIIIFDNNIVRCNENTEFTSYMLAIYGSKHLYVSNNTIDINPSNGVILARLYSGLESVIYYNNLTYRGNNIDFNGYTNTLSFVRDNFFSVGYMDVNSLTDYDTGNYNVFEFNRIAITLGSGAYTQNIVFKPFFIQDKLSARTYKANAVNSTGDACIITFTINEDGTLAYSVSTGTLHIRQIGLFNE